MRVQAFKKLLAPLLLASGLLSCSTTGHAARYALLVGVGEYAAATGDDFKSLAGPEHDVASLRAVAIEKWNIKPENIQALVNSQGTRSAILKALDELVDKAGPGDSVFVYFSGHGTSSKWVDEASQQSLVNMPDGTGALVPYDFDPLTKSGDLRSGDELARQLIIGRWDLRPRFEALDRKKVHTWVVVDACYSGNAVRSAFASNQSVSKQISIGHLGNRTRGYGTRSAACKDCADKGQSNAYPYKNVVFFSAASESELALDLPGSQTYDGKPHGAFTDSLLRVLDQEPSRQYDYKSLYKSVKNSMKAYCGCNHRPVVLPTMHHPLRKALNVVVLQNDATASAPSVAVVPVANRGFTVQVADSAAPLRKLVKNAGFTLTDQYPTVRLSQRHGDLVATDTNGELINQFNGTLGQRELSEWLSSREWLYNRIQQDDKNNRGMMLDVREGLTGHGAEEGSKVYFSALLEQDARLLVLDAFGDGDLVVLYPKFASEMAVQPAGRQLVIPAKNGDLSDQNAIDPIQIMPPFGTDTVMVYALSGGDSDRQLLERFRQIANKQYPKVERDGTLMRELEQRLRQPLIDTANLKLFTYPMDSY